MLGGIREFYNIFPVWNDWNNQSASQGSKSLSSANSSSTSGKKTAFSELFGPRFAKRAKPDESAIEC